MDIREAVISSLMPISERMDEFLQKYEYIDANDPTVIKEVIKLLNSIQTYINNMYLELRLRESEWHKIARELFPNENSKDNNDEGITGFRQNDSGKSPPEGSPQPV